MSSSQFYCEHCKLSLNGHAPYTMHLAGKKHLKALKAAGKEAPTKGPQGLPDSTVTEPVKTPVKGYGGKFVSQSKIEIEEQTSAVTEEPIAAPARQDGNYSYSAPGQYEGYGDSQYTEEPAAQYESYGQYSGQHGENYVAYPTVPAVQGTSMADTTDNNDPVMNAVRANILGKLATKRKISERCEACQIDFSSLAHKEQHMAGKKHKKKIKIYGADGQNTLQSLYCEHCKLQLNAPGQMEQHLAGTLHRKKTKGKISITIPIEKLVESTGPSQAKKTFVPTTAAQADAMPSS